MSKRADPTLIGAFVIAAMAFLVIVILLFSSGDLLVNKPRMVMYFKGSVHGLQRGAAVSFRGVRIGTVKEVKLAIDIKNYQFYIPVYIEIDPRRLNGTRGEDYAILDEALSLKNLVDAGLRAQLQTQSLLTGQLYIDLDFMPDKPVRIFALNDMLEIPTVANTSQELYGVLEDNDLNKTMREFSSAISAFNRLLNMPELKSSVQRVDRILTSTESIVAKLDVHSEPLLKNLTSVLEKTQTTLAAVKQVAQRSDSVLLASDSTLQDVSRTFVQLEQTLKETRDMLGENSQLRYELTGALKEISAAARAVRSMADTLDREPEALFSGKTNTGVK